MTPEELTIARRLVACEKWAWLPGMLAGDFSRPTPWRRRLLVWSDAFGWKFDASDGSPVPRGPWKNTSGFVPDLADPLTRLGVLEVVRRASGDGGAYPMNLTVRERVRWIVRAAYREFAGPTEIEALLAALEAAP